jgi:hypothetical protein
MPDTRPDTPFTDGVCQACINHANRPAIDWDERREALMKLLDRFDGKVLVPSSGGKDSHYQVLTLRELGADVTTVTAMTCMPTEIGLANLDNLERYAPGIRAEPDRDVRRKLNRLGLEMVGDISWPEHVAIFTVPWRIAQQTGHRLLMWGENPQNHYGGPAGTDQATQMTRRWRAEFGGFLGLRPADLVGLEGISAADMTDYTLPENLEGIEAHFLGAYMPWDSLTNAQVANQAGMRQMLPTPANWMVSENQDNAQTGLHDWFGYAKFGYGRGCAQASMYIRAGRAKRESVMEWLKAHDGLFPATYMNIHYTEVLEYIGMPESRFWELASQFTNSEIFEGVPGSLFPRLKEFVK